jgi:hypothetical protein
MLRHPRCPLAPRKALVLCDDDTVLTEEFCNDRRRLIKIDPDALLLRPGRWRNPCRDCAVLRRRSVNDLAALGDDDSRARATRKGRPLKPPPISPQRTASQCCPSRFITYCSRCDSQALSRYSTLSQCVRPQHACLDRRSLPHWPPCCQCFVERTQHSIDRSGARLWSLRW